MMEPGSILESDKERYLIKELHGQGGFGLSYRAVQESSAKEVLVKILRIEKLSNWKSLELFSREAQVLQTLAHPNIPVYIDNFSFISPQNLENFAIVQEFIPGNDLQKLKRQENRFSEKEMLSWFSQILSVLEYLHSLSPPIIHRDINPKNIILRPDGQAFLVDFGTVQAAVSSQSTLVSTAAGTFGYAPMEQFMGRAFAASDLYGLAMSYLAVASGKEPEDMPLEGVRVNVRQVTELDARLVLLLERMTEPDPRRRLASARVALERIRPLLQRSFVLSRSAVKQVLERTKATNLQPPKTHMDDLLPSDRLREAKARLEKFPSNLTLSSPRGISTQNIHAAALSPTGVHLWFNHYGKNFLLHTETLSLHRMKSRFQDATHAVFDSLGEHMLVALKDQGVCFIKKLGTKQESNKIIEMEGDIWSRELGIALSPAGNLLAISTHRRSPGSTNEYKLFLYDGNQKRLLQKNEDFEGEVISFSPDGSYLICQCETTLLLLGQQGEKITIPGNRLAFSPDGRILAIALQNHKRDFCEISFGPFSSLAPKLSWKPKTIKISSVDAKDSLCFSPNGRFLAVGGYGACPVVIDIQRSSVLSISPGDLALKDSYTYRALGFSSDSSRVFSYGDIDGDRFIKERHDAVFAWEISSGRFLGTLMFGEHSSGKEGVFLRSASGFYGRISKKKEESLGFWQNPSLVFHTFSGGREEELLSPEDMARFEDFEARWAFFESLRRREIMAKDTILAPLLDASVGLTHLLPLLVEHARHSQAENPSFGASSAKPNPLTVDLLCEAAEKFASLSQAEQNVFYEELLQKTELQEETLAKTLSTLPEKEIDPEKLFQQGILAEVKEDKRWLFRKNYTRALTLFIHAASAGHLDAADAVDRVRSKMNSA